jgi:hypothetical protein
MPVISVNDTQLRKGAWKSERKNALVELVNRHYTRTLVVITNSVNDGPEVVIVAAGVPRIADQYVVGNDADTIATCTNVVVESTESPFVWKVTAEYETDRLVQAALNNPLNQPAEVQWGSSRYERVLQRDQLGIPMCNTAGDKFDPPLTAEDSRPLLTVTLNSLLYDPAIAQLYQDACNTDVFAGAAPYAAKMNSITAVKQIDIGFQYWRITYEIEFRRETFALFVLDQGYRNINGYLFFDKLTNLPFSYPIPLNGRGFSLLGLSGQPAKAILTGNLGVNDLVMTLTQPAGYPNPPNTYLPPLPIKPGTPYWYFELKIDDEIVQCWNSPGANTYNIIRGMWGSIPAAHGTGATAFLQPYFLRFQPYKSLPFAPLNLGF